MLISQIAFVSTRIDEEHACFGIELLRGNISGAIPNQDLFQSSRLLVATTMNIYDAESLGGEISHLARLPIRDLTLPLKQTYLHRDMPPKYLGSRAERTFKPFQFHLNTILLMTIQIAAGIWVSIETYKRNVGVFPLVIAASLVIIAVTAMYMERPKPVKKRQD